MKVKKLLSLLLSVILLFSMTACAKGKADKYCSNCGNGVSKNASFCDECGVEIGEVEEKTTGSIETTSSTESVTTTTTQTTTTTAKKTTTTTAHKHSYKKTVVAPSCTDKGYTIYKCACGKEYKDDYTDIAHNYKEYVCSKCGAVDRKNAYGYLKNWLMQNGTVSGEYVSVLQYADDGTQYGVVYAASEDYIYVSILMSNDYGNQNDDIYVSINLKSDNQKYEFWAMMGYTPNQIAAHGIIEAKSYRTNSPLKCDEYQGEESLRPDFIELSRQLVALTITYLDEFIDTNVPKISIADLGFTQV